MSLKKIGGLIALIILHGCASNLPEDRQHHADLLAEQHGWQGLRLPTSTFTLAAYTPAQAHQTDHLTIYFEGDGLAWISASQPSFDPTPRNPVALELALRHPNDAVAYLARPCQYVRDSDAACKQAYWTHLRFSPEVIESSNQVVERLKCRVGARDLTLVGYSGGGAVAALVAARRNDVTHLVTVAGNLDHQAWTTAHRIDPLTGSLNPADEWKNLATIRQTHLLGGKDQVIRADFTESYRARFPSWQQPKIVMVPEFDHHCCWVRDWDSLVAQFVLDSAR